MGDALLQSLCGAVDGAMLMRHIGEFARWIKLSGSDEARFLAVDAVRARNHVAQALREAVRAAS